MLSLNTVAGLRLPRLVTPPGRDSPLVVRKLVNAVRALVTTLVTLPEGTTARAVGKPLIAPTGKLISTPPRMGMLKPMPMPRTNSGEKTGGRLRSSLPGFSSIEIHRLEEVKTTLLVSPGSAVNRRFGKALTVAGANRDSSSSSCGGRGRLRAEEPRSFA